MGIKMARASDADMEIALQLMQVLERVADGEHPDDESDTSRFDPDEPRHLKALHRRLFDLMNQAPGAVMRVVGGFHTILHNDVLDPDQDTLQLHPRLLSAVALAPPGWLVVTGGGATRLAIAKKPQDVLEEVRNALSHLDPQRQQTLIDHLGTALSDPGQWLPGGVRLLLQLADVPVEVTKLDGAVAAGRPAA